MKAITVWILVTFYNGPHYAPYPFTSFEDCKAAIKEQDTYSMKCVKMTVLPVQVTQRY